MISHIEKGGGFGGVCRYVEEREGAQVIDSNMSSDDPTSRAREFRAVAEQNPRCKTPVFHASLSCPPGERLTDEQWRAVARDYMQKMGFSDCQYTVVRHTNTPHDHVHIVANRVRMTDYKVVSDKHDRARSHAALREIEKKYGLQIVSKGQEINQTDGYAAGLRARVDASVKASRDMPGFIKQCQLRGVDIKLNQSKSTGRISGMSFSSGKDGKVIKGRDLGKSYSAPAITGRIESEHKHKAAEHKAEGGRVIAVGAALKSSTKSAGKSISSGRPRSVKQIAEQSKKKTITQTGKKGLALVVSGPAGAVKALARAIETEM